MRRFACAAAAAALALSACVTPPPPPPDAPGPPLTPEALFLGRAPAEGVLTVAGGGSQRFTVENVGRREGQTLLLDQVIRFADGDVERRSWRLRQTAPGLWEGTATGVRGPVRLERRERGLRLTYTLERAGGVRMEHWFARRADGAGVSNTAVGRWLGVPVARIVETITPAAAD